VILCVAAKLSLIPVLAPLWSAYLFSGKKKERSGIAGAFLEI